MHWGVRRFENHDGTLTPSGKKRYSLNPLKRYFEKKAEAKALKQFKNDVLNKAVKYSTAYDSTPNGKALLKEYQKAWDRLDNAYDTKAEDQAQKLFDKAERTYLTNRGRYEYRNLSTDYSKEDLTRYADLMRFPSANTLEERFAQESYRVHAA